MAAATVSPPMPESKIPIGDDAGNISDNYRIFFFDEFKCFQKFIKMIGCNQFYSVITKMVHPFEIVGVMSSHFENARYVAFPFHRLKQMSSAYFNTLINSGNRVGGIACEVLFHLIKNPGVSDTCSANHDAIYSITIF